VNTIAESARIVRDAGVPPTAVSLAASTRYVDRTRRARRYGIVLGLIAGFGPLAARSDGGTLLVPRMFAGYLVGLLASELFAPRRQRPARRSASLRPRTPYDLVGRAWRWLPWLILLPVVASPLLLIGWHPRGRTHSQDGHGSSCTSMASWPSATYLFAAAGVALVALVAVELTLHRLTVRQQPAEDRPGRFLDHAMRGHSARSAVAAASALGLVLLAQLASAVDAGVHSDVCTSPIRTYSFLSTGNVYSWGSAAEPWLQQSVIVLILLAVATYVLCRRASTPALDAGLLQG
jgi:hypothetical protein